MSLKTRYSPIVLKVPQSVNRHVGHVNDSVIVCIV